MFIAFLPRHSAALYRFGQFRSIICGLMLSLRGKGARTKPASQQSRTTIKAPRPSMAMANPESGIRGKRSYRSSTCHGNDATREKR